MGNSGSNPWYINYPPLSAATTKPSRASHRFSPPPTTNVPITQSSPLSSPVSSVATELQINSFVTDSQPQTGYVVTVPATRNPNLTTASKAVVTVSAQPLFPAPGAGMVAETFTVLPPPISSLLITNGASFGVKGTITTTTQSPDSSIPHPLPQSQPFLLPPSSFAPPLQSRTLSQLLLNKIRVKGDKSLPR